MMSAHGPLARPGLEQAGDSDGDYPATAPTPPEVPTPSSPATERARPLGLPSATALVIGSIIGTSLFTKVRLGQVAEPVELPAGTGNADGPCRADRPLTVRRTEYRVK